MSPIRRGASLLLAATFALGISVAGAQLEPAGDEILFPVPDEE